MQNKQLSRTDWLAIERTRLANERTFLAYFRTFIVFLGTAIAIFQVEMFENLKTFGIILAIASPIVLIIGLIRLFTVKKRIKSYYQ